MMDWESLSHKSMGLSSKFDTDMGSSFTIQVIVSVGFSLSDDGKLIQNQK